MDERVTLPVFVNLADFLSVVTGFNLALVSLSSSDSSSCGFSKL